MATLVRIGDAKVVDRIFDRVSLAGMDTAYVDNLADRYLGSLERATTDIGTGNRFRDANFAPYWPKSFRRSCRGCVASARLMPRRGSSIFSLESINQTTEETIKES